MNSNKILDISSQEFKPVAIKSILTILISVRVLGNCKTVDLSSLQKNQLRVLTNIHQRKYNKLI